MSVCWLITKRSSVWRFVSKSTFCICNVTVRNGMLGFTLQRFQLENVCSVVINSLFEVILIDVPRVRPLWSGQISRTFPGNFKVYRAFLRSWYTGKIDIYPSSTTETTTFLLQFLHLTHSDVPYK